MADVLYLEKYWRVLIYPRQPEEPDITNVLSNT